MRLHFQLNPRETHLVKGSVGGAKYFDFDIFLHFLFMT